MVSSNAVCFYFCQSLPLFKCMEPLYASCYFCLCLVLQLEWGDRTVSFCYHCDVAHMKNPPAKNVVSHVFYNVFIVVFWGMYILMYLHVPPVKKTMLCFCHRSSQIWTTSLCRRLAVFCSSFSLCVF